MNSTRSTWERLVRTRCGMCATGTDSIFSCGKTSRNQPMYPLTASIAPTTLTAAFVTRPATTSITPKAKTIGDAVGAGSSTVSVRRCASACELMFRFASCTGVLAPDDVYDREHHDPHRVHEMPIERQHVDAVGVLLPHAAEPRECHHGREQDQADDHVKPVQSYQ